MGRWVRASWVRRMSSLSCFAVAAVGEPTRSWTVSRLIRVWSSRSENWTEMAAFRGTIGNGGRNVASVPESSDRRIQSFSSRQSAISAIFRLPAPFDTIATCNPARNSCAK